MTLVSFPSPFGKPRAGSAAEIPAGTASSDWSQQELADLYRIESLLVQANMRVETDRGTTDEGEPWFVFCRPDGEVFVHLCRIEQAYLLDSPGLEQPLRGANFAELIDQFVRSVAARAATSNVVQFRKARHDNVVRLHPAIMMAALIWSLYLASDQLMEAAQAAELDLESGDASTLFGLMSEADGAALVAAVDAQSAGNDNESPGPVASETGRGTTGGEGRGLFAGAAVASLAATLTAIAVTYGLIEQRHIDLELAKMQVGDAGGGEAVQAGAAALDMVVAEARDYDGTSPMVLARPDSAVTIEGLAELDLTEMVEDTLVLALTTSTTDTDFVSLDGGSAGAAVMLVAGTGGRHSTAAPARTTAEDQEKDGNAPAAASSPPPGPTDKTPGSTTFLAIAEQLVGSLHTYTVGGKSVSATFDVENFKFSGNAVDLESTFQDDLLTADAGEVVIGAVPSLIDIVEYLPENNPSVEDEVTGPGAGASGLGHYDSSAQAFVTEFMTNNSANIGFIVADGVLIIMDKSAVDDQLDHYASKSWIMDDETRITVVGHYDDFLDDGLLFI